jgi:type IV secretion system protein VirB5
MNAPKLAALVFVLVSTCGLARPAAAQFAVIDPAALVQLLIQVQQLAQQVAVAQQTLTQAQQAYAAVTGGRGMQFLAPNLQRNYLPTNWAQLTGAMAGAGGPYGALGSDVSATVLRNAVLSPGQIAFLSAAEADSLNQRRRSVALLEALSRAALANTSDRFNSLQTLITGIGAAADEKAILDLQARIGAEQGMLANEATKLQELYKAAEVQAATERQRADEKIINDIGRLNQLPPMGLK